MSWFKLNKNIGLAIAFVLTICNVLSDRYFAPSGILLTPFIIVICTILISMNENKFDAWTQVALIYLFIAVNDIGIKLYGGGIHDNEGLGWINMMLIVGLVPSFLLLIIGAKASKLIERLPTLLFIALISFHFYVFGNLGLGRIYL